MPHKKIPKKSHKSVFKYIDEINSMEMELEYIKTRYITNVDGNIDEWANNYVETLNSLTVLAKQTVDRRFKYLSNANKAKVLRLTLGDDGA